MCIIGFNSGTSPSIVFSSFVLSCSNSHACLFFLLSFQLWLVFHICTRICVLGAYILAGFYPQANGESMENLLETLCCSYGFSWAD